MPFIQRRVEPGSSSKHAVPDSLCGEFDAFSNAALANILRQLGSLMQHASDIFQDLEKECMVTFSRSQQIKTRIWTLEETVGDLDHKREKIRELDLKAFEQISQHYESRQVTESNHFTAQHRPQVIANFYSAAERSPGEVLKRFDDTTPDDEVPPSAIFHLMPVITAPYNGIQEEAHVEKTATHVFAEREYRETKVRRRPASTYSAQSDVSNIEPDLPPLEELTLKNAISVPSCVVEVDTGGAGFDRMCSLRKSQRESLYGSLPTLKRRKTFSGGQKEDFSTQRNTPFTCSVRQRPWTMHANERTVSNPVIVDSQVRTTPERETSVHRYEKNPAHKKGTMSRLKRAFSFSKLRTKSTEELQPQTVPAVSMSHLATVAEDKQQQQMQQQQQQQALKQEKKSKRFSWFPKFLKRSKSKKNLSVPPPPPRSASDHLGERLAIGPASYERPQSQELLDGGKMDPMQYKISKRYALSMPDVSDAEDLPVRQLAASPLAARHKAATIGPAYKNTEGVAMRRGNPSQQNSTHRLSYRRSVVLIADSKLMDTAVAMRDSNGAIHKDDQNSSSGNWSGSSDSTRRSQDSDLHKQNMDSQASLDSALGHNDRHHSLSETRGPQFIREGAYFSNKSAYSGSAAWITERKNKALTQNNLRFHNTINGSSKKKSAEDDKSSTYSEDEDGYFTSMRLDSGLKRSQSVSIDSPSTTAAETTEGPRRCISAQIFDKKDDSTSLKSASSFSGSENISSQSASTTSNTSIDSVIYVPLRSSVNPQKDNQSQSKVLRYLSESDFHKTVSEYDPSKKSSITLDIPIPLPPAEVKSQKAKPPPPVRKSSLASITMNKDAPTVKTEQASVNSKDRLIAKPDDAAHARIKSKTLINAAKFPSTVSISPDTSDDEGHPITQRRSRKQRPCSADNLLDVAEEAYSNSQNGYDYAEQSSTLPRSLRKKKADARSLSWPRRPKKNDRPGILKTGDKEANGSAMKQSKTLNFATHVNVIERTPPTSPEMNTVLRRPPKDKSCYLYSEPYRKPFIYLPDPVTSLVKTTRSLSDVPENGNATATATTTRRSRSVSSHYASSQIVAVNIAQSKDENRNKITRSMSLNVPNSKALLSSDGRALSETRRLPSQESVSSAGHTSTSSGTLCDDVFGSSDAVSDKLSRTSSRDSLPRRRSRPASTSPYNSLTRTKKNNSSTSVQEEIPEKYMPTIRVTAGNNKGTGAVYANTAQLVSSKSTDSLSSTTSGLSTSSGSTQTSGILIRPHRSNSVGVRSNPLLVTPVPRPKSEYAPSDNDTIERVGKSGSKSSEHLPSSFNLIRDIPDCLSQSSKEIDSTGTRDASKSYYERVYGSYVPPFLARSVSESNGCKRSSISSCDSGVGSEDKCNGQHQIQRSISENGPYDHPIRTSCGGPITIAVEVHSDTLTRLKSKLKEADSQNDLSETMADPMRDSGISESGFVEAKPDSDMVIHNLDVVNGKSLPIHLNVKNAQECDVVNSKTSTVSDKSRASKVNIENKTNVIKCVTQADNDSDSISSYKPVGLRTTILPQNALNGDSKKPSYLRVGQSSTAPAYGYRRSGPHNAKK